MWFENFQDDLYFLCTRYSLIDEYNATEQIDVSGMNDEKAEIYKKTAREFYFKVFEPLPLELEPTLQ